MTMLAGNCAQACVAEFMGLDLEDVPDFTGGDPYVPDSLFWERFHEFLDTWHLEAIMIDCRTDVSTPQPRGKHLACGNTIRGIPHMCIYEGDKLCYDPHASGVGLLAVAFYWLLVPMDLSEWEIVA